MPEGLMPISKSEYPGWDSKQTVSKSVTLSRILEIEEKRRQRYREFWDLYKGNHWSDSELDEDGPTPVWNKCRLYVDKSCTFLVGKQPKVKFPSKELQNILGPYVNMITESSGGMSIFSYEAAQMGSVSGDCFIKLIWDPTANYGKGGAKMTILDSEDVSAKYSFVNYSNVIPDEAIIEYQFLNAEGNISIYRETITANWVQIEIDNEVQEDRSGPNALGFVYVVHIRNLFVGKEPYGLSDMVNLENMNKLLNSSLRRFKDDVDYHGDPVTLLYGMKLTDLEKGEGKLWGNLPTDGKVENLELKTDFKAQQKFMEYVEDGMAESGSTPLGSTKGSQAISNTTGVALAYQYLPLTELTTRKKITYGAGLKNALMASLQLQLIGDRIGSLLDPQYVDSGLAKAVDEANKIIAASSSPLVRMRPWNYLEIEFQDFMPKDKLIELQIIKDEIAIGLETREGGMERLGKQNIAEKLKAIDKEREAEAERELRLLYGQPKNVPPRKKIKPSKDISQGVKASALQGAKGE